MSLETRIEQIIEPALTDMGYGIVLVRLIGLKTLKLQLFIERLDGKPVAMDDCVRASREVSTLLDVEDPIPSSYVLEVSSPGEDRPLAKKKDFQRFVGNPIKLETHLMINGQKRFRGMLVAADETQVTLQPDDQEGTVVLRYDEIMKAKLQPEVERKR